MSPQPITPLLELCGMLQGFGSQLHRAAEAPSMRELSRLLLEGAPVDGEDEEGCTALHCAAAAGLCCLTPVHGVRGQDWRLCPCRQEVRANSAQLCKDGQPLQAWQCRNACSHTDAAVCPCMQLAASSAARQAAAWHTPLMPQHGAVATLAVCTLPDTV